MKRLLGFMAVLLLLPALSLAEEPQIKKIIIFPFKTVEKGSPEGLSNEVAAILGAQLEREGGISIMSGGPFSEVVRGKVVDPARIARIANRTDSVAAIWGSISKLEDGYSIDVSVMGKDERKKPRQFSSTGKDMEELIARLKDLAAEIGTVVLDRPKIGSINIEGNRRVQKETILNKLGTKPGETFSRSALSDEIRELYNMGYFDDVQIRAEDTPTGQVDLNITLKERPSIKNIEIEGNKVFAKDELLDTLTTKSFTVASTAKIRDDIAKIKKMYEKEGYYQPKIDYEIKELTRDEAKLVFKIEEGRKSFVTDIVFEGREKLPEKELAKLMTIKEKSWFWFLDESGAFTTDKLEENRMRIAAAYMENGFINVQVGAPKVDIHEGKVKITFPIREGNRFQVRKVDVEGDLLVPREKLLSELSVRPHTWIKRSSLGEDLKTLTRLYNNMGYAYVDVEPRQKVNEQHNFVDLTYRITKGEKVSIEKVDITGNERTRDKVIRRNLIVGEGDVYNADAFENTKSRLEQLDFFEAVRLKTTPGSRPDLMNVTVEVMEKKTGSLAAGLGYSSQDGATGNINLKERNLFGLGIVADAKANISGRRNSYEGSLSYPWLFDLPLSGSLRGYKSINKELNYVRDSEGFGANLAYPLYREWSMNTGISRDSSKLGGFEQLFARSIVSYYTRLGVNPEKFINTSENALSMSITRDTRNNAVLPSAGSKINIGTRIAGFGGDVAFSNCFSEGIYYYPLFWRTVFKVRGNGSLLLPSGDSPIPFDRRILLGGIGSIRGYRYGEIGPKDHFGNIMGGDRSVVTNIEYFFPLVDQFKLNGVAFFDVGNAWNVSDGPWPKDVKAGYGIGIRWISPMGPLRIEYGWKVNPSRGEDPGAFAFAMGQLF